MPSRPPGSIRWARVAACAASAAILLGSAVSSYVYHELRSGMTTSDALAQLMGRGPRHPDNAVNVLLIGLDSRKDMNGNDLPRQFVQDELHAGSSDIGGYNTNTLILLHIPADGGRVQAFSIPRDDYVQTFNGDGSSQGFHKIKEAYGLAKAVAEQKLAASGVSGAALEQRSRDAGRAATLATVENFLGQPIDHFAEVNLLGFYDIAQVVQPITVCLKHATQDPAEAGQGSGADFHAGLNQLNASQALSFVRQRHNLSGGDLDRTARQQAFLSSVVHKLKTEGVLGDLGKTQGLLDVVKKDVVLDSGWRVLDFLSQAPDLTGGNVEFHTLPVTGFAVRDGESVNLVDPVRVRALVQSYTTPPVAPSSPPSSSSPPRSASPSASGSPAPPTRSAPAQPPAVVDVFNASGVRGAAAAESAKLATAGWTPGEVGNAPAAQGITVRYGPGADAAAGSIAGTLGVSAEPGAGLRPGHVEVVLGAAASSAPSAQPAPQAEFYGTPVRMGGIPCVD